MYKKIIDPEESYVSDLLKEGYSLHSVTPKVVMVMGTQRTDLVYHFIKEVELPTLNGLVFGTKIKDNTITEDDNGNFNNAEWWSNN